VSEETSSADLVVAVEATTPFEAEAIVAHLIASGIEATAPDFAQIDAPLRGGLRPVPVLVRTDELEEARRILAERERREPEEDAAAEESTRTRATPPAARIALAVAVLLIVISVLAWIIGLLVGG
jgi:hypothetical protein